MIEGLKPYAKYKTSGRNGLGNCLLIVASAKSGYFRGS